MIKVMMLINSYNLGGAEKLVYDLAERINIKKNVRVYICAMKSIETRLEKHVQEQLEKKNIVCLSINKGYKRDRLKSIIKIANLIFKYKIDILHTHGQAPDFYGRIAAIFQNRKVITTIHSTNGYSKNIEKILKKITNEYTAVSKDTEQYCREVLKIRKKVTIINNGIDCERYKKREKLDNSFIILSVGRVEAQKGYLEIIDCIIPFLKRHVEAKWNIVGHYDQESEYYKKLINIINENNVGRQINFMSTTLCPEKEYWNADCFLLNSVCEGFGIAYIEAMAAELPVLGNCVGVIKDIIEAGGKIGLISEINVENYLERILNKDFFSEQEIIRNREIVEEKFSIESCADKYVKLYEKVTEV